MDSPSIKQTVCKVLIIFQHVKYLVAYVLIISILGNFACFYCHLARISLCHLMWQVKVSHKSEMAGPFNRGDTIINKHIYSINY